MRGFGMDRLCKYGPTAPPSALMSLIIHISGFDLIRPPLQQTNLGFRSILANVSVVCLTRGQAHTHGALSLRCPQM